MPATHQVCSPPPPPPPPPSHDNNRMSEQQQVLFLQSLVNPCTHSVQDLNRLTCFHNFWHVLLLR